MFSIKNNVQNQSNKTVIIVGTFLLIASFAGIMMSMPQTVGIANAQTQQGLEHACPPGTTSFSQGECVVTQVGVPQCPPVTGAIDVSPDDGTCRAVFLTNPTNGPVCYAVGGTFSPNTPAVISDTCNDIPKVCTTGDLVDNQCVVTTTPRPGVGNQR